MKKVFTKLYIKEVVVTIGNYCYRRLSTEAPKPIAYLFNGHRLPPLPPLRYPYAIITSYTYKDSANNEKTGYRLYNTNVPWEYYGQSVHTDGACSKLDDYFWTEIYEDWQYREGFSYVDGSSIILVSRGDVEWTNHNIPNPFGIAGYFMKATDPVPVYE